MKTTREIKTTSIIHNSREIMKNPLGYSNHPLGEDYYSFSSDDTEISPYEIINQKIINHNLVNKGS